MYNEKKIRCGIATARAVANNPSKFWETDKEISVEHTSAHHVNERTDKKSNKMHTNYIESWNEE